MVKPAFGPYNKQQMAIFVLNVLTPTLKKKIQEKPRTFWNYTINSRVRFVSAALKEILDDPKNAILKNAIQNTPYATTNGFLDMPYYALASKLQNVV